MMERMTDEIWEGDDEGDDEGDVLPVLGPDASEPPLSAARSRSRARRRPFPRGGIPTSLAAEARRQVLAEATGKDFAEPDEWREDLAVGNRGRASSDIQRGGDHNSASGFGLA